MGRWPGEFSDIRGQGGYSSGSAGFAERKQLFLDVLPLRLAEAAGVIPFGSLWVVGVVVGGFAVYVVGAPR